MITDAVTLLGHASSERSQLRCEDTFKVSANMPVAEHLFGGVLLTQLSHIRATNKISNTSSTSNHSRCTYLLRAKLRSECA